MPPDLDWALPMAGMQPTGPPAAPAVLPPPVAAAPPAAPAGPPAGPQPLVPPFVPPDARPPAAPPPVAAAPPAVPTTSGEGQQVVEDAHDWRLPGVTAPGFAPQTPAPATSLRDALTGESRTQFPNAPEFLSANPGAMQGLRIAAGYLTSAEPAQVADIIRKTLPDAEMSRDRFGNQMVKWKGTEYYVNKPGASGADLAKLVADIGTYGAAGKLVGVVSGIVPKLFVGAAVGGATSLAQDAASTALGSDQGLDPSRALLSAGGGALAEALVPVAARVGERLRRFANTPRLLDPSGAPTATATAILRQAGVDVADYTAGQLRQILTAVAGAPREVGQQASTAAAAARGTRQGEFGIPRTRGQVSGDRRQLDLEDSMRHGGLGPEAQTTMAGGDAAQREAAQAAAERLRAQASGSPVARDEATLGQQLQGQVRTAERASSGRVDTAYTAAGRLGPGAAQPLAFEIGPANSLVGHVRSQLTDVLTSPKGTPQTTAMLKEVARLEQTGGATLGEFETLRRQAGTAARGIEHTSDGVALIKLRKSLDTWADDTIQRSLYAGNDSALEALKTARAARTAHGLAFEPSDAPRKVSALLERAQSDHATGQETFNALFGAGQLGSAEGTAAAVAHLRTLFPGDSNPVISAMREGAVQRVMQGLRPAEPSTMLATAQRLDDALSGKGREVMQGLFSATELAQLRRYSAEIRDIHTLSQKQNASGTAYKLSQLAAQALSMAVSGGIANALGHGPMATLAAGGIAGSAARMATGTVNSARASSALNGSGASLARQPLSDLVTMGLRGGVQAGLQQTRPDQAISGLLDP